MNKVKLLVVVSTGLLLANVILIVLFLQRPPGGPGGPEGPGPRDPRKIIIERLGFDQSQQIKYDQLIDIHRNGIDEMNDSLNEAKRALMSTLTQLPDSITINALENKIGKYQVKIEAIRYEHFAAIRKLCKPDQLHDFDELVDELPRLIRK